MQPSRIWTGGGCEALSHPEMMELGYRTPIPFTPYDAAFAEVEAENRAWWSRHPRHSVHTSRDVAGMRRTAQGVYGTHDSYVTPWDARQRFGHRQDGGRGIGMSDAWDLAASNYMRSSQLQVGTTSSFSQRVECRHPVLRIVSDTAQMRVRVTVGSDHGGAEDSRDFFLGQGFIFTSDLSNWTNVRVQILETEGTAVLQESWETAVLQDSGGPPYRATKWYISWV